MRVAIFSLLAATFAIAAPTGGFLRTTVILETSHMGFVNPKNVTVIVPVGPIYRNKTALASVSKLYILNDDSISCIPYYGEIASGPHGNPFTFGHPSVLPKIPIAIGSIMCTSNMV
ncbi:hypothetical protein F4825DRAFT_257713 [Nemania diffusa]|nr:hypothetical protein F4825DRAFT_257713 [Nemania diffusa]